MATPARCVLTLADEDAMRKVAARMADLFRPGDFIALSGDLGAGKTTFARTAIRTAADIPDLEVPSPTYTILQTYDTSQGPLIHADFYRVGDATEIAELGFDELAEGAIMLVEWPERLPEMPRDRLEINIALAASRGSDARDVTLIGYGAWAARLAHALMVQDFLERSGWGEARRRHLQGDASSRKYERLIMGERSAILMDAPARPDGPPIRDGKPYSRIAHLAEDVRPFMALARGLGDRGLSAPNIYAADPDRGLLLLEDFGTEGILVDGAPVMERHAVALDALVLLHTQDLPGEISYGVDAVYTLPTYDLDAMLVEIELLADWYIPHRTGLTLDPDARDAFRDLWGAQLAPVAGSDITWVLRDVHSPNLMWLPARDGTRRAGFLDFQDAVMGPAAYDVVSLLQDARVDVPEELELSLLGRYVSARKMARRVFDPADFTAAYAVMGAQRATKILGIFARLAKRDGKPGYLRHMPRVWRYLMRNMAHPALEDMRSWYKTHVPAPDEDTA